MKIFSWDELSHLKSYFSAKPYKNSENFITAITIGGFDGPHIGHQSLFDSVFEETNIQNQGDGNPCFSGVVTFTHSPGAFKLQDDYKGDLSTLCQKISYFEKLDFDFCVIIDFTEEFRVKSGYDFLDTLIDNCNLKFLAVGEDFRCGYKGGVGLKELQEYLPTKDVGLNICPEVDLDGKRISSSLIREFVFEGDIKSANTFLGHEFIIDGQGFCWERVGEKSHYLYKATRRLQDLPQQGSYSVKVKVKNHYYNTNFHCNGTEIEFSLKEKINPFTIEDITFILS